MMFKWPSIVVPFKLWNGLKVYSNGVIKTLSTDHERKGSMHRGYYRITFIDSMTHQERNLPVHRIVAINWLPKTDEDIAKGRNCIDHIDGNRANNDVANLRWCTVHENNAFNNHRKRTDVPVTETRNKMLKIEHIAFRKRWNDPDLQVGLSELIDAMSKFRCKTLMTFVEVLFEKAGYDVKWIKIVQDGILVNMRNLMFRFQLVLNTETMKFVPKLFVNIDGKKTEVEPSYIFKHMV